MKISAELPLSILGKCTSDIDYDFIIASHCINHPKYLEFYTLLKERNEVLPSTASRFSILDNGAFEEGKAIDSAKYRDLIQQLNPNVIVLPDVVNDKQATIDAVNKFLDEFGDILKSFSWMGVLQGETYKDYMECYEFYSPFEDVHLIGIPYHRFYRPKLINDLKLNELGEDAGLYFHALGLPNPFELRELRKFSAMHSVDTSLPVTSGKCLMNFEDFNWQKTKLDMNDVFDDNQLEIIKKNINFLKHLITKA